MNLSKSALGLLIVMAVVGGSTSPLVKYTLQVFPPVTYVFLRFLIAAMIILPFAWDEMKGLKRNELFSLMGLSFLATANIFLFTYGIRLTSAIVGQTLYVGVPVMAILATYILHTEPITSRKVGGIALGFIGSLSIILLPAWAKGAIIGGNIWGNLLIMIAVISFTFYSVLSKKYLKQHSPIVVTAMFMLMTCIVSFLILPFEIATTGSWWTRLSWPSTLSILYLGVLGTGLSYYLYQYAIKKVGSIMATLLFYLLPATTFLWAYLLLGEVITVEFILGVILVFSGAWLVGRNK